MRRFGPLLLVATVALLAVVAFVFRASKERQRRSAPPVPESLPSEISKAARDWCWSQTENHRTVAEICAASFRQLRSPSRLHLEGVQVKLFSADGATFHHVKTASAEFDTDNGSLYAEGEVEIIAAEPLAQRPPARRVFIRTSGLKYESRTGRASTDRPTAFRFAHGEGNSVGASYEPEYRELHLRSEAVVTWRRAGPRTIPLTVETGELVYKEKESAIILGPWYRLRRGQMTVEGGRGILWLKEGDVRRVEGSPARGTDRPDSDRQVEYSADYVFLDFGAGGEIERITADKNARFTSIDKSSGTTVTAARIDLEFDLQTGESRLRQALARGSAAVESVPAPGAKAPPPRRVLRSEAIELAMDAGGREIHTIQTRAPGVIEFLPTQPVHSLRRLEAGRILIAYAKGNQVRSLEATGASTRTEPPRPARGPAPPPMLTWSRELRAEFDATQSELTRMEQWGDFRYEQGDRRGRAGRAAFQAGNNLITLTESARVWDPSGSLSAPLILMNQQTGDVEAEGGVASTREPERDKLPAAMLSQNEPFHARAARMLMAAGGRRVRYQGEAVVWQGGNRIEADWIEIDRGERTLAAGGSVRSRFVEQSAAANRKAAAPVFTLIKASELQYADKTRTALYRGGVAMTRAGMEVTSAELRGIFAVKDGSSELEAAYADGNVRIVQSAPDRKRAGTAEHAEYLVTLGKVVLSGGEPQFTDSRRGSTRGQQLTWFADNDRLLVDGRENQPASSVIHLK